MKIQYIKSQEIYDIASVEQINDNVVQVTGDIPIQEYGFMLSEDGETFDEDYSHYRTIYRTIEGGGQFSNNGNVYTGYDKSDIPEFNDGDENIVSEPSPFEKLQAQVELLTGCILELSEALYG